MVAATDGCVSLGCADVCPDGDAGVTEVGGGIVVVGTTAPTGNCGVAVAVDVGLVDCTADVGGAADTVPSSFVIRVLMLRIYGLFCHCPRTPSTRFVNVST